MVELTFAVSSSATLSVLCVARLLLVAAAVGVVAFEQHDPLGGGGAHGVRVQIQLLDGRHHDLVRRLLGASVREFRST